MTLEEAIQHCEEVARANRELADKIGVSQYDDVDCVKCAKAHEQLAEWLKELKGYREAKAKIESLPLVWEYGQGVEDCLAIIDKHLQEVTTDSGRD